ncbi:hypothetical protein GCM10009654_44640 [Streptomyces hebeiensis]|uniref:Transposase n=1 Tax=Streptomyces hebeiensis TaxID=229486 RepID=A0ABN1UYS7_9ACTN
MREQSPGTAVATAELEATVHAGGFWRLVPESVPRVYDPVTYELLERVLRGLKRLERETE